MQILFICNKMPYPPNDGGTIATFSMITAFAQLGWNVHVIAMQTYKHNFLTNNIPLQYKQNIKWHTVFVNTKLNPFKAFYNLIFDTIPYNAKRFINKAFEQKITDILSKTTFDIIQLESLYLSPYTNVIRENCNTKIALRAHNVEHQIWERMYSKSKIPAKWYIKNIASRLKKMELMSIKNVDFLIPITQNDANILNTSTLNAIVKVVQTGINPNKFIDNIKQNNQYSIFYIGALDWTPNTEALNWFIDNVWQNIKTNFANAQFNIAGRNANKKFKKWLLNIPVNFYGQVDNAVEFIDNQNIMVVPLFTGSGMRIKIIEAMARGKCIVTTTIGAEGINITNGQHLFIADTAQQMTQTLDNLFKNPQIVYQIGQNALSFVKQNFDNTKLVNELALFYQQHLQK